MRGDRLIVVGQRGEEALETAVITGHDLYDGEFELGVVPTGEDGRGDGDARPDDAPFGSSHDD
jgi:hypothetical protein